MLFDVRHGVKKRCQTWHRVISTKKTRCHVWHRFLTPCLTSKSWQTLYLQSITQLRHLSLHISSFLIIFTEMLVDWVETKYFLQSSHLIIIIDMNKSQYTLHISIYSPSCSAEEFCCDLFAKRSELRQKLFFFSPPTSIFEMKCGPAMTLFQRLYLGKYGS